VTAPGGRFVEIGKTDVRDAQQIATNIAVDVYRGHLLDQFRERPEQSIFRLTAIYDRSERRACRGSPDV